jgi:hypothetical protein
MNILVLLCVTAGLFQEVSSLSDPGVPDGFQITDTGVLVPKLKSDFKKGNATAQWAPGHPKSWGSEDYHVQFNDPLPETTFSATVTKDEKFLVMFNMTHARFLDMDSNTTVATIDMGIPPPPAGKGQSLMVVPVLQGGFDLIAEVLNPTTFYVEGVYRTRVTADLKPVGTPDVFAGAEIGAIDKDGRMALTDGNIYDLNRLNYSITPVVSLKNHTKISFMDFSPDAKLLSACDWEERAAQIYNATSGDKVFDFPPTNAQLWVTKFSPDGKYVLIALGSGTVQVFEVANLTAPPTVVSSYVRMNNDIAWSPDSKYLATSNSGNLTIWKFPGGEPVQSWAVDLSPISDGQGVSSLGWLDGGEKFTWLYGNSRGMYDFESGKKWWWSIGVWDHAWDSENSDFFWLGKKGQVITVDGDAVARFWKI